MSQRKTSEANADVILSLMELLAIAKVAMPDYLYEIDPRVHKARRLLERLEQSSVSRPPTIRREPPIEMVDLTPADHPGPPPRPTPWDITAGLDAFMATPEAPATRSEAVVLILREWFAAHGYIETAPDQEEQH